MFPNHYHFLVRKKINTQQTPFCSDGDYTIPACPSSSLYTAPQHEARDYYSTTPSRQYPEEGGYCDTFGDICKSESGASSGAGSRKKNQRHQRPLALAVGYGDYWKDNEGRRVIITPSSSRRQTGRSSPYQHRSGDAAVTSMCTCAGKAASTNSLLSPVKEGHDISPHQTKSVMCKHCSNVLKDSTRLEPLPASRSAEPMNSGGPPLK